MPAACLKEVRLLSSAELDSLCLRRVENCSYAQAARSLKCLLKNGKAALAPRFEPQRSFKAFTCKLQLNPHVAFLQQVKKITVQTAMAHEAGTSTTIVHRLPDGYEPEDLKDEQLRGIARKL
jgi:hypothetical protein